MAATIEATDGVTGQMYSDQKTVGQLSSDGANQWHQFFGAPAGEIKTNPYDKYQYETYTLPDAYTGKNIFVRDTIEGFLDSTNNWYTTVALPTQVTDQLHVRWNEFHFDQALASIVPEEGISRLITSSKEAREDHTIRHGLAFVLEHGFMTTEEGRRQYLLNIQQIAQSVQETNNYDALSAILNCREYEREWEKRHSMIRTPWNDLGKREVMEFGIVQKDFRGFEILHEKYKHRLNRYGVTPNMWVFPPGLALYAAFDPLVADYNKDSRGVELNTGPEVLGSFRGLNVFETREFDVRQGELPINLLQRRVQIGEHYYLRNHHSDNKMYRTNLSMDIVIYNEDRDDWEKVNFRDAVNHTQRFKTNGSLNTDDFQLDPPADDLFTYKSTDFLDDRRHQWCDIFGQMEPDHLPAEALRAFCESAEARYLAENITPFLPSGPSTSFGKNGDEDNKEGIRRAGQQSKSPRREGICEFVFGTGAQVLSVDEMLIGRPRMYTLESGGKSVDGAEDRLAILLKNLDGPVGKELKKLLAEKSTDDYIAALELYVRDYQLSAKEIPKLFTSARFQKIMKSSTTPTVPVQTEFYLNRGAIMGDNDSLVVFIDHMWVRVNAAENQAKLFALCHPMSELRVSLSAITRGRLTGEDKPAPIEIGSKRPAMTEPPRAWKRRGISEFTDQFAPVGARGEGGKDSYNYALPGSTNYDDLDFSTMEQGLKVNDKHVLYAEKMATLSTDLQMQIARCLYYTMIRGEVVQHWMNSNFVLPFSVIVARPFMTYDMATCVMMKGGSDTGATYQGHSDFQLGDDVQSKIHYGNYTYYSKAIVTNHKNIIIARNVMANGYVSGDGTTWRDPVTQKGDMCAFLVPYNEHKKSNPLRVFSEDTEDSKRSMTGALFYSRVYNQAALPRDAKFSTLSEQEDSNEITYMGHHFWWKPHREHNEKTAQGSYTGVTINTGHWGPKVYPGCGRVRSGDEVYLKDIDYGQEVF